MLLFPLYFLVRFIVQCLFIPIQTIVYFCALCVFVCLRVCAFCSSCSIQRVIILNGEIKGLQTIPVIQLSISWLISKQRRGMTEESAAQLTEGEAVLGGETGRGIPVYSGGDVDLSITLKGRFCVFPTIFNTFHYLK